MCRVLLTNDASVIGRHYLPAKKSENLAVNESRSTDFFLSPMLADVSPAAGSDLMSPGSTGISVSEGPLWGGTGRSASDRSALGFTLEPLSPSSTMQSSCSLEASPNTLVSSGRGGTETFNARGSDGVHDKHDKSRGDGKLTSTFYRFKNVDDISKLTDFKSSSGPADHTGVSDLPWPTSGISVADSVDIFCTAACHNGKTTWTYAIKTKQSTEWSQHLSWK